MNRERTTHRLGRVLRIMLCVTGLSVAISVTANAQPGVVEECRQTQKVYEQYKREMAETQALFSAKVAGRDRLSDLNRAIAGRFVVSSLDAILSDLDLLPVPTSTKDRLAAQRAARDKLQRLVQQTRDTSRADLETKIRQIQQQMNRRAERMRDLNCADVLAREEKGSCTGFLGTWETKYGQMTFTVNGGVLESSYNFDSGSVRGRLSQNGTVLSGTYTEADAEGRFYFILSADGQTFTGAWNRTKGKTEPPSGKWDGKCVSTR